ncbi:hypothetical protein FHS21_004081 [Phyllobacterium trifolii]|uniref:Uncharacterized protein n=1 Tax=Phyllobacterium trifolii TaxID=300193 RepID=A0A839UAV2_9HYPH|nr:hypothetical protein [Phyllobacterium trifolii]MBB3147657.1 hypothetical protein [Phyllobacterium trifolii]
MYNILADRTYTSSDCATMSRAYEMAAAILQRDPRSHDPADRLGWTIMKLFDQGMRDAKLIATTAADKESKGCEIGTKRDSIGS